MVNNVVSMKGNASIESAVRALYEKHIGSVVITDDEEKCEGILTARDVLRVILQGGKLDTPLKDVMTKNPITVREDNSYSQAISIVASHGIRHLPVINEKGRLTGIFSVRSFLDEIIGITR